MIYLLLAMTMVPSVPLLVQEAATQDVSMPALEAEPAGLGQETEATPNASFDTSLSFDAGFTWQFESSLNEGGEFTRGRFHTVGEVQLALASDLDLVLGWRYQYDHFLFDNSTAFWTDINTVQLDAGLRWQLNERWMVFGGGQALWSVERGGDWGDGLVGGGLAGFSYAFSDDLVVGAGVGVRSQLEDDVLVYPVIVLDWQITDRLSLDTHMTTGWANQTGAELVYELAENLDLAVAVVFDYERFRLSNSGPTPGGVGSTETLPIMCAITWAITPQASVTTYVGFTAYGRISTTAPGEIDVYASRYDPAAVFGIQGAVRF